MGNRRFEHWTGIRKTWAVIAMGLACLAGCTMPPWGSHATPPPKDAKSASSTPPKSSGSQTDAQALQQVMNELQQVGALDPVAQDKLMADLKQVDPSLWPMVLQTFRAEAAYRRREEQREAAEKLAAKNPETAETGTPRDGPRTRTTVGGAPETRLELKSSGEQVSPVPSPQTSVLEAPAEAVAPLPSPLPTAVATEQLALSSTAAPEPPSAAARLTAIHGELASSGGSAGLAATAGAAPLSSADWQNHLSAAIRSIEMESKAGSKSESDIALQARLRMLYLLAGRRDDAMRPLPTAPQAAQDYWSSQIYGLSTWMDTEKTPDSSRRAAETKRILGEALAQLGETAPLAVHNLTFCREVSHFGSFEALKSTEFAPGQKVLLYAEIDNLHIESSAKGYHWAVKINGQIFDNHGNRMADYGASTAEETYQTPRHDFFVSKLYYLPRLVPNRYTLQLTVEDTLGRKVGQSSIDFTVKPQ
jgi:hypothetical protein